MTFDQDLRDYLEEIERRAPAGARRRYRHIDEAALRRHLLDRLRRLEGGVLQLFIERRFERWSPKLGALVQYLERLPEQDVPIDPGQATAFACRILDRSLDWGDREALTVDELEFERIARGIVRSIDFGTYAIENHLVHRDTSDEIRLTGLGRAFLRLHGKDAVRWLLTVEMTQSRGNWDSWRASRALLERALSGSSIHPHPDEQGEYVFPFHAATLHRLSRLDVLHCSTHQVDEITYYELNGVMRDVIQAVLAGGPWHAAVAALLEDERAVVLQLSDARATEAAIEQTRLIAHEVRNALIPVRHHVDALLKARDVASHVRLEKARHGVVRVLAFVDEMVATSELVGESPTALDVGGLLREALGDLDGAERVQLELASGPLRIRAPRSRLRRAISNVLLNALQATSDGQLVRVRTLRSGDAIKIAIDDAGPGVPEESRIIVFRDGFTTRGGAGGIGFGLAYVQRVVEELRGRVWCEGSDLGGARFVIELPEDEADK